MKRFTETEKWDDPWFRKLKPRYKSLYEFLRDRCDSTGVWIEDLEMASKYVGESIDGPEALKVLAGKVIDLGNGKWLLPEFVDFQYGDLSPTCNPHKRILKRLSEHNLRVSENGQVAYLGTLPTGSIGTLEDKDKDKDKDKDRGSAEGESNPISELGLTVPVWLRTEEFLFIFNRWIPFRKAMKKNPKDWKTMFQSQLDWLGKLEEKEACDIVSRSIRNGWQGLIEPEKHHGNHTNGGAGNGKYAGKTSSAEERNRHILGAESTKRAILEAHSKPQPKPWDNLLPGGPVST